MNRLGALLALILLFAAEARGVEVVRVLDEGAGKRAGLLAGDHIRAAVNADGTETLLQSPFDVQRPRDRQRPAESGDVSRTARRRR
jgi:hypothetical protein